MIRNELVYGTDSRSVRVPTNCNQVISLIDIMFTQSKNIHSRNHRVANTKMAACALLFRSLNIMKERNFKSNQFKPKILSVEF